MDVDRQPKKAFFAYRDALEPLMLSLRSDRDQFYTGDTTQHEIWISNDRNTAPSDLRLHYQIEQNGKVLMSGTTKADVQVNGAAFAGYVRFKTPLVTKRSNFILRAALIDKNGNSLYQNSSPFTVFPRPAVPRKAVYVSGTVDAGLKQEIERAGFTLVSTRTQATTLVYDSYEAYVADSVAIHQEVRNGKKLIFTGLPSGIHTIAGSEVSISNTSMGRYYFASPYRKHPAMKNFEAFDINNWYSASTGMIAPLLGQTFYAQGWQPLVTSGSSNWVEDKGPVMASGEMNYGKGCIRVNLIELKDKLMHNPTAMLYFIQLISQ